MKYNSCSMRNKTFLIMQCKYFRCLFYLGFGLCMSSKKKKKGKKEKEQKIIQHLQYHTKWVCEYIKFPNTIWVQSNVKEWEGHLGSNKISDQRKTCHKPICFQYRYLDAKYSLPRNHWRGMIQFFHSNTIPICLCRPYSAFFFLHCWKADQPTRRSTS